MPMIRSGDIISYLEMCQEEGANLQRGMNFRFRGRQSVILMSLRPGAPYADRVEEDGRILIYEGHDISKTKSRPNSKRSDQPMYTPSGKLSQNGLFFQAAENFKSGRQDFETIRVYEKIRSGIWVFNGLFKLVDAWQESSKKRKVFKFRLELIEITHRQEKEPSDLEHDRLIPTAVKLAVWKRDKGQCIQCGSKDNLHFDHIIPFSKGGSSLVVENIQLLCARHNLAKRDRIE
jgi:hypothetical protein